MNGPLRLLPSPERLQALWETRAGRTLRMVGLDSVRTTILTLAVLATLIPALATSWISYRQNRRAIEAKLNEQLAGSSAQASREVGLWLKERLYDLRVFAASYEVTENVERGGGSRRLPDYLTSIDERFRDFDDLSVIAPDLRTVATTARRPNTLRVDADWIRRAREGEFVLGDPERVDSASAPTMELAVPIVGATGRFLGLLAARLTFDGIGEPMRALVAGPDGRLELLRPDGRAIVSVGSDLVQLPEADLRRLEAADGAAVAYDAPDGVALLGAMSRVTSTDWTVVAEIPAATAFADIRRLRNTTLLLVVVLLLVVGSLAYGLGLLIVLPLERLSRAADRVAGGDLDVDVPVSGGGEVSQLAEVFNQMVRRLREGRAELERLSVTDELTGLASRRRLTSELEREVQRSDRHAHEFAVLMLDVDEFKQFNDTYGHPAGDAVLKRIAQILSESAREVDTVARYGGEEFVIILPETTAEGAEQIAERIRANAASHRHAPGSGDTGVSITVSIGCALFPTHGRTPDELVEAADRALYDAKQRGRNRVVTAG